MREAFGEPDARQQSARPLRGRARIHAPHQQRHRHILERGELGQQVMELIDEADRAVAQMPALGIVQPVHGGPRDLHRAARRQIQSAQQLQQRGLAGPGCADDGDALAGADADRRAAQHLAA